MFNLDDPFFKPLWLRVLLCMVALGWGLVEATTGSPGFAIIFLCLGAYAAYRFFVKFFPDDADIKKD